MRGTICERREHPYRVHLRPEIDRRINFAMQQNDVTVVSAVHVENLSNTPLRDLRLRIIPEPQFADPWEAHIDLVTEGSTYNLEAVDLVLSPRYLGELTERIRGQLRFDLFCGEERLAECVETVELLARDEWSGLASLPEILAAFAMPNHPTVEYLLREAADILDRWSEDPSLAGYQRKDPKRVYMMAAAIYSALQHLGITYVSPPASFEAEGQRIRLPDRIVESRMAAQRLSQAWYKDLRSAIPVMPNSNRHKREVFIISPPLFLNSLGLQSPEARFSGS